ncbi:MAG: glycosyltransferase family 4 protein [Alloprevotella sp.]
MSKRVIFLLPGSGHSPIGGHKVVYEYANRLVADSYEVDMVYPAYGFRYGHLCLPRKLWRVCFATAFYVLRKTFGLYSCRTWYRLDERVREHWVFSLNQKNVPAGDIYVATAVRTSIYLNSYKGVPDGHKFYLIQDYENWGDITEEILKRTYRFPFRKIVISSWLKEIVNDCGESCTLIPNGFDFDYFKLTVPLEQKDRFTVCMGFSKAPRKSSADGLKALAAVKEKYPQLRVNLFGVSAPPAGLPEWCTYFRRPDRDTHVRLYNEAAVFVAPSHQEGWGLTVGEAMMCGCAVACTDNRGHREMAIHQDTALLSPVKDTAALAANILRLIEDDSLRRRIAQSGNRFIQRFTWDRAYGTFSRLIADNLAE